MSWTRHTGYQDPANYLGYITSSKVALADKGEPSNPNNDYCQKKPTLYDAKAAEITRENPLLIHDQFMTTNKYLHGRQDQDVHHKFSHGIYNKAPGLSRISYIRPDHNIKLPCSNDSDGDGYNYKIVPFVTTEFRDAYGTKRGLMDCGNKKSPSIGYIFRDVGYPKKITSEFGKSASIAPICDTVSPQISTTHSTHRKFSNEEVKHFTQAKSNYANLTLKLSIQPMEDPYERTLSIKNRTKLSSPDNRDIREAPPSSTDYSKRKLFFNSSPYKGCHPVPYGPTIPGLGDKSQYQSSYTWPKLIQTKEDFTCGIKALNIQPKELAVVGKLYQCPNATSENDIGAGEPERSTLQSATD